MTLLRGYGGVDEDGKVALKRNFLIHLGLQPDSSVSLSVMRIKGSGRKPYLIIHRPEIGPQLSPFEVIFYQCSCRIDTEGRMVLDDRVVEECDFKSGLRLEFKLVGPTRAPWLVIKNRGPKRLTSLQEKMGIKTGSKHGKDKGKWKVMEVEY